MYIVEFHYNWYVIYGFAIRFSVLAVTSDGLFLTVIALDRFVAIVFPLRKRLSIFNTWVIIASIWFVASAVALPTFLVRKLLSLEWYDRHQRMCEEQWPRYLQSIDYQGNCIYDNPQKKVYYSIQIIILYYIPIIVMMFTYATIGYTLWSRRLPGLHLKKSLIAQQKAKRKVCLIYINW